MTAANTAIVPAAGRSRRMGRPKLLLPLGGGTVLGATLAALAAGGAGRLVVVRRPDDRALADWLGGEAAGEIGRRAGLAVDAVPPLLAAVNPSPERGMLSSILAGLDSLGASAGEGALLVCPGDLPALSAGTVAAVLAALERSGTALPVPVHGGRRGHPLAIAPRRVPEIPTLDLDVGLRQLLDRHPDEILEVPVDDPGCVRDVDTPEDYEDLRSLSEAEPTGRRRRV